MTQGSVSPLALVNDTSHSVQLVLAADMLLQPRITMHPLTNTATVSLASADFLAILDALGHRPEIIDFDRLVA